MNWALIAGYDFFVSYRRGEATPYANGLVRALQRADYRCFLDDNDTAPGQPLTARLRWALLRSKVLLVVASPSISGSAWIPKEIEMFLQTKRDIIPISIQRGLERALAEDPRFAALRDKDPIWIVEAEGVGPGDEPSAKSIADVTRNFTHRRSNQLVRVALLALGLTIAGSAVAAIYQRNVAREQRNIAQAQRGLAEQREARAIAAQKAEATAKEEALAAKVIADEQRALAVERERQAREATRRESAARVAENVQRKRATRTAVIADLDLAERYSSQTEPLNPHVLMHLGRALRTDPGAALPQFRLASLLRDRRWFLPDSKAWAHDSRVISARFSPDAKSVLSVAWSGTVYLWDSRSARPIFPPIPHDAPVLAAGFSPDGQRFATVTAKSELRLWNSRSGALIQGPLSLPKPVDNPNVVLTDGTSHVEQNIADKFGNSAGDPYPVGAIAFSPDGRHIFAAGHGTAGVVIDIASGAVIGAPLAHMGRITAAAFDTSGRRLATANEDNLARVWNVQGVPTLLHKMQHSGQVLGLSFDGGSRLVTVSTDKTAKIWDIETGSMLFDLTGHSGWVLDARFSHAGNFVATASSDGSARLWDTRTGKVRGSPIRHDDIVTSISVSEDDRFVATASSDRTVRVSRTSDGRSVSALSLHTGPISTAEFARQGSRIVSASTDKTVRVWYMVSNDIVLPPMPRVDGLIGASSRGGDLNRWIVSNPFSFPQLVDADSGRLIAKLPTGVPYEGGLSASGQLAMTASADRRLKFWDGRDGRLLGELQFSGNLASAKLRRDGQVAVAAIGSNDLTVLDVSAWSGAGPRVASVLELGSTVRNAAFSDDGRYLLVDCVNNEVSVHDGARAFARIGRFLVAGRITRTALSGDGGQLAIATTGGTIELLGIRGGASKPRRLRLAAEVESLRFDASGAYLVVTHGSARAGDWRVSVIDVAKATLIGTPIQFAFAPVDPRQESGIVDAIVDPRAMVVVTVNHRRELQSWDLVSGKPLSDAVVQARRVVRLSFSKNSESVLVEYVDGRVVAQDLLVDATKPVPNWVPGFAETIASRRFDEEGAEAPAVLDMPTFCNEARVREGPGPRSSRWNNLARQFCEARGS